MTYKIFDCYDDCFERNDKEKYFSEKYFPLLLHFFIYIDPI